MIFSFISLIDGRNFLAHLSHQPFSLRTILVPYFAFIILTGFFVWLVALVYIYTYTCTCTYTYTYTYGCLSFVLSKLQMLADINQHIAL